MRSYTYFCVVSESPQHLLLQALNDQNQAAIDERLATEGVKAWINHRALPEQLDNPIRELQDVKSITCLTFASLVKDVQTVRKLVESGADPTVTDSEGYSVLHYACASRVDAQAKVTYLLQRDASLVNAYNHSENAVLAPWTKSTPLHVAARHNQTDCIKILNKDGKASVNATDERGRTALHLAAAAESAEAVNMLVQHPDCRVNATDEYGKTALHDAAEVGSAEAVKVLVQHPSCDFSITDEDDGFDGDTAAGWARRWRHDEMAALIDAQSKGNITKHFWWSDRTVGDCDVICPFALCLSLSTVYRFQ